MAQIQSVDAVTLKSVLLILLGVVGLAALIKNTWFPAWRVNGEIDVTNRPAPLTRAEWESQRSHINSAIEDCRVQLAQLQDSRSGEISAMRVAWRDDIQRIHERIDDLPDKIIATLKNTGAI